LTKFGKPKLKHVLYAAYTSAVAMVVVVAVAAPVGMECLAARSVPMNVTC
jgi:hypothetical protein